MSNLGRSVSVYFTLFVANALVALAFGVLYAGCRSFNDRTARLPSIVLGAAVWTAAFPTIYNTPNISLLLLLLIAGFYAALSAWELWRHAPQRLVSQRAAVVLLPSLAAFSISQGLLELKLSSIFWIDAFGNLWSAEMVLVLVLYAPALAFVLLSMVKEQVDLGFKWAEQALRESEERYRSHSH
jgi:hypothetical protein